MNNDIGSTQERPVLRSTRRRSTQAASEHISDRDTSYTRGRKSDDPRSSKRYNSRHSNAGQKGRRRSSPKGQRPKRSDVPIVAVILLMLLTGVISVLVTRAILTPKIEKAEQETASAKSQIATLTKQLDKVSGSSSSSDKTDTQESSNDKNKDQKNASSTSGVEDPWVESGYYTTGDTVLDGEVKAFCDAIADKSKMDQDTALLEVYKGVAWAEYVERDSAQKPAGKNWRTEFARMYYENDCSGNCYEFAAFLSYCLQYLGLSDAKAEGVFILMEDGDWGDHGIVFVTNTDGSKCLCDTARGTDGWMLPESTYNIQMQDFEST